MPPRSRLIAVAILAVILIGGLITAGRRCAWRLEVERDDRFIETVLDFDELRILARREGWQIGQVLAAAAQRGASSIAISEDTLASLEEAGRISVLSFQEIEKLAIDLGQAASQSLPVGLSGSLWLHARDPQLLDRIQRQLERKMPTADRIAKGRLPVRVCERRAANVLVVHKSGTDFRTRVGLGVSPEYLDLVRAHGLGAIIRIYNHPDLGGEAIAASLAELPPAASVSALLFAEKEVFGHRGKIAATGDALTNSRHRIGWIEFVDQAGMPTLMQHLGDEYPFVRVHSISEKEIALIYTPDRAVARFVRAAQDRRLRLLYIRCFWEHPKQHLVDDLLEYHLRYLQNIATALAKAGFAVARTDEQRQLVPPRRLSPLSVGERLVIGLALWLGPLALAMAARRRPWPIGASAGWVALGVMLWLALPASMFAAGTSLAGAIGYATLGSFLVMRRSAHDARWLHALPFNLAALVIPSIVGGLLVAGLHAEPEYLLGFSQFRGVKLAFMLPLLLVVIDALRRYGTRSFALFSKPLRIVDVLLIVGVGLALVLYLLRSGNVTLVKPSAEEDAFRTYLEDSLVARPRNKEFLIGYPAMFLFLFLQSRGLSAMLPLLAVFMQMGQVSVFNTFCHFHSPLAMTLLRTLHGLWLGVIVGLLAVLAVVLARLLLAAIDKKPRVFLVGYFGFGNLGDELLWRRFVNAARTLRPDLEYAVLWGNRRPAGETGPLPPGVTLVPRQPSWTHLLEELAAARMVAVPGGSVLQTTTSFGSFVYYFVLLVCGRLFGARLALIAQGYGPFCGTAEVLLTRILIDLSRHASVRHATDLERLNAFPGPLLSLPVGADLAFLGAADTTGSSPAVRERTTPATPFVLGVILRGSNRYARHIAESLAKWRDSKRHRTVIKPLFMQPDEDEQPWTGLDVAPTRLASEADLAATLSGLDALLTMRLHGAILATMCETPWIGFAVDPKITAFAKTAGVPWLLNPGEFNPEELETAIDELIADGVACRSRLHECTAQGTLLAATDVRLALERAAPPAISPGEAPPRARCA